MQMLDGRKCKNCRKTVTKRLKTSHTHLQRCNLHFGDEKLAKKASHRVEGPESE